MPNITTIHAVTYSNITGDELLLKFSAKFQRKFKILLVKLHNLPWQRSLRLSGAKMAKKI